MTGIPVVDLVENVAVMEKRLDLIESKYKLGEVKVLDAPHRYVKPSMIRSDIEFYRSEGLDIKAVYVDYADIMTSDKKFSTDNKRHEYGDIYEELRSIAKEYSVAMFTASQGNRGALDKKELDLDDMSEDFSKAFTADYVIGLCQTKTEAKERMTTPPYFGSGKMRIYIAKNRNQQKGDAIGFHTDLTRLRLCLDDWFDFDTKNYGAWCTS